MVQFQASQPLEGLSTTKPPFFDGTNYNYWKNRMKVLMFANVPKAWIVTMKGPYVPMKVVGESELPKEEVEWNDEDLVKIMINNKAINILQCALNPTKFHRVSGWDTTKEMWDMLEMKPEESIQDMYTRLNDIVTNLKALSKVYPSKEVLEDLIGKLMTYEIEVQVDGGVEVVEKKKKNVAFKANNQKEESEDDASNEEDITKLVSKEVGKPSKKHIKCYECNKMGHYRDECSQLKKGERKNKNSMKKKTFTATWSKDDTSSMESESTLENGIANLCFMAQEDSNNDEENEKPSNALKKENEDAKKENEDLKKKNEVLKRKACDLENVISKFTE
ncbi:hypothetical protein SLEP1_g12380 [Rubroshorea leprosula]|uniref:CCHC-type domain-containing protein n=1 Tax=Rubroshorea leprosula TaxID=152421 RepID=A0AAV5II85_9ROSI|nr:hypothetical protein SLEP1_g12380 [Rubroshorea leprosula]